MATPAQVQQLYITYFGRPADPEGLRYWTTDTTTPLETIADGFATTPEFTATIEGKTLTQIVSQFYVDLFGRTGEPAGVNYWVDLIAQGITTIQQVGLNISNAALALPATNADNIALTSKITASGSFSDEVGLTTEGVLAYSGQAGIDSGVAYLAPVLTEATIPDAAATTAAVTNLITSNSGVGATINLSSFTDIFTPSTAVRLSNPGGDLVETLPFRFTSTSQSVSATIGSIQVEDQLIDPSTADSDNFNITVTPGTVVADLTTTNIENFAFFLDNADRGGTFDFNDGGQLQTNVKKVVLSGTLGTNAAGFGYQIADFADAGATVLDASGVTTPGAEGAILANAHQALGVTNVAVTMSGGAGNDTLSGGNAHDVISGNAGIDLLVGNEGDDTMSGGTAADIIFGNAGNDSISGGADADTIVGDIGSDTLLGDSGNDTIDGGTGDDSITGGTGVDSMTGGLEADTFLYGSLTQLVADTGITELTSDVITDFVSLTDKIQTGLAGTATNFKDVAGAATYDLAKAAAEGPAGFDGAVQYVYTDFGGNGVLFVDTDKNNTADASILFTGDPALAFGDIIA